MGSRGAPRRRERAAGAARRPGRPGGSREPCPRRSVDRRVARTVGAGDRRGDRDASRATPPGCSRSARRRAPVPDAGRGLRYAGDGTANEAARRARPRPLGARPRHRAHADGARSPRGPLRARRRRDLPRPRATAVGRRQPVPPRARGRAPAPGSHGRGEPDLGWDARVPLQLVQLRPGAAPALRPRRRAPRPPGGRADRHVPRIRRRDGRPDRRDERGARAGDRVPVALQPRRAPPSRHRARRPGRDHERAGPGDLPSAGRAGAARRTPGAGRRRELVRQPAEGHRRPAGARRDGRPERGSS